MDGVTEIPNQHITLLEMSLTLCGEIIGALLKTENFILCKRVAFLCGFSSHSLKICRLGQLVRMVVSLCPFTPWHYSPLRIQIVSGCDFDMITFTHQNTYLVG